MSLAELIAVANGEKPADLILANARIINTFTGEVERGNVAIFGERIAGIGDYSRARKVIDLKGRYLAPGLINGHTHIESSLLSPAQYARAVVPHGTTALISDLHEIANVGGVAAMKYIQKCFQSLPLDFFLMAPSCVPATPAESSGARLGVEELEAARRWKGVQGLGEMMNFPGVLQADEEVLAKLKLFQGKVVDGHAPGLSGKALNAYRAAGIQSDHETVTREEGEEKLRRGFNLMIREGSSEKNLEALLPLVTDRTYPRCLFVVDDRTSLDLVREGDIDAVVRKAIARGLEPVRALQLATLNPAQYFRLEGQGAIAPGYLANLIVINNLSKLDIDEVFYRGRLVAQRGKALFAPRTSKRGALDHMVKVKPFSPSALKIPQKREKDPTIEIIPGQIVTRKTYQEPKVEGGFVLADPSRDLLKLVVVERHRATGNIGVGLVKGFGLKRGALASSLAHDSHNLIAVGVEDGDIYTALKEVERLQGGLVVVAGGKVLASLPLPVAGLLSDLPLEEVVARLEELHSVAASLGCELPSPFATLSFMALPVIPELRLTDKGLVEI